MPIRLLSPAVHAVQHCPVVNGYVVADNQGATGIHMEDAPVLDIGPVANPDGCHVAAHNRCRSNTYLFAQGYVAHDHGRRVDMLLFCHTYISLSFLCLDYTNNCPPGKALTLVDNWLNNSSKERNKGGGPLKYVCSIVKTSVINQHRRRQCRNSQASPGSCRAWWWTGRGAARLPRP